ncbi:hypothetical protein S7711_02664 [Stachybotrys chartarum IBT 7711]|uniref:Uncharacterized protein n=1 Tax=Stachybotrys chartarum (strain CBS 109288 / IBT 7711) TaxID=1280523 RepID=A0A084AYW2_STACB|nr:hypothetical protein S7711_02664 [Stachybotrys chartarum IBT 7711]KFA54377.1 hypothetical protein S40293_04358 [Stachybotrys chartarum IBT 40293]KFA79798.1 hypothetical protein S40288_00722 [Stachybotrys chartarum IBT 40288]
MGITDIPPEGTPSWVIPLSTALLGGGVGGWLLAYILMVRRSLATKATPVPFIPLGLNLAWELVFAFYVTETWLEFTGFLSWLLLDIPVLYATLSTARHSFAASPLVARNAGSLMAGVVGFGVVCYLYFAHWWLEEEHRGYGVKWGKSWYGHQARDTTELAYWTAGFAQVAFSVGALAMLLQRGHSGGQSYGIWFCRFAGTLLGLPTPSLLLWWVWPEAHGYVWQPLSVIMIATGLLCDVAYPFLLAHVRSTEQILPDGTIVAGGALSPKPAKKRV